MSRTALITGATRGIGRALAEGLAPHVDRLVLVGRDRTTGDELAVQLRHRWPTLDCVFLPTDLSLLRNVERLPPEILGPSESLDCLINNAACLTRRSDLTVEGCERMLAVNVLAPFHLTNRLLPSLLRSSHPLVLNITSNAHRWAKRFDVDSAERIHPFRVCQIYGLHKLINLLHVVTLRERFGARGLLAQAHHPGEIATGLGFGGPLYLRLFWSGTLRGRLSPADGAAPLLGAVLRLDPNAPDNLYLEHGQTAMPSRLARDPELADRAWDYCERRVAGILGAP